jgi:5-methylcytosine-specific restriction protein B
LAAYKDEFKQFIGCLNSEWLRPPSEDIVIALLNQRRFIVIEGPPGTGKSRLAIKLLNEEFAGRGLVVQFHPATTYEDFVIGLTPNARAGTLSFEVKPGHLLEAAKLAASGKTLLVIDEMNRADLGRVLGEAIYLLEANDPDRTLTLAHDYNGQRTFKLPENLFVVATMNSADRSIAHIDIAIRRRFAFVTMMPDRAVVKQFSTDKGLELFDALCDVFLEYAPDEALSLLPGHSYFMCKDESGLKVRMRHELVPLLDEYIREAYLGSATTSLHSVRNIIADYADNA